MKVCECECVLRGQHQSAIGSLRDGRQSDTVTWSSRQCYSSPVSLCYSLLCSLHFGLPSRRRRRRRPLVRRHDTSVTSTVVIDPSVLLSISAPLDFSIVRFCLTTVFELPLNRQFISFGSVL